jgi:Holliday junction resolvase RusA-like endonuclease
MKIAFEIPGQPEGKGRPRFSVRNGRPSTRTPDATVVYENYVRVMYQNSGGARFPDDAALSMDVLAFYQIPKSASQKKKNDMQSEKILPTKKPDLDNVLKVIADSLNGMAYRDDSQIVDCRIRKFYSDIPRVYVEISEVKG